VRSAELPAGERKSLKSDVWSRGTADLYQNAKCDAHEISPAPFPPSFYVFSNTRAIPFTLEIARSSVPI
jgi:hypothetical protein